MSTETDALRVDLVTAEARLVLSQDGDSAGGSDFQTLTVEAVDAGGGHFLVLSTERWAIDPDGIDAFVAQLRRVLALVTPEKDQ